MSKASKSLSKAKGKAKVDLFDVNVIENFRFQASTGIRYGMVFKKVQSGERLRKVAFTVIVFIVCVWTIAVSVTKSCVFIPCGRGLSILRILGSSFVACIHCIAS